MSLIAIALPVTDARVVSSRDVLRLGASLPCVLGLRRKHSLGTKHTLALPPSANATWGGRVRWELAMVQAFGVTYPPADAERGVAAIGPELLQAVADARSEGDVGGLAALAELLGVYERRLGALLPNKMCLPCPATSILNSDGLCEPCPAEKMESQMVATLEGGFEVRAAP